MNRRLGWPLGVAASAVALALLTTPAPVHSQTPGVERRIDRRQDRSGARGTRQTGRQDARGAKVDCLEAGDSRPECRQQKRRTKQDARQRAHDIKRQD